MKRLPLPPRVLTLVLMVSACTFGRPASAQPSPDLRIRWQDRYLTVTGHFPGGEIPIHYLEAYCRPGSTDRDWRQTVIPHRSERLEQSDDGRRVVIRDVLSDGVEVRHVITADGDHVDFTVTAHNPTNQASAADWAQPCMRVDQFTGAGKDDAREKLPSYVHQCFLCVDGEPTFLPTRPWAREARYVYGQVYVPADVDREDVNPRPLSPVIPSCGLCGCVSEDGEMILAVGWEPFQEIFQGVIACLHSDFRIGGLQPGETKTIHGKLYVVPNDPAALLKRYRNDFPTR